jgi:hypothetical protein
MSKEPRQARARIETVTGSPASAVARQERTA